MPQQPIPRLKHHSCRETQQCKFLAVSLKRNLEEPDKTKRAEVHDREAKICRMEARAARSDSGVATKN